MVLIQTRNDTMELVGDALDFYDRDPGHSSRVTDFSLAIFDELRPLHGYGRTERRLLELAGMMHDIGYSQEPTKGHHKASRDLILGLNIPGLTKEEKLICALVARYHTGELPDASKHHHFGSLPDDGRDTVEWLAGILRVGDALDCKHLNVIRSLQLDVDGRAITIVLETAGDCRRQIKRAREKEALLVQKSGRALRYRC